MLKITCPKCRDGFEVPESLRGQDERCPVCGHVFPVEAPPDVGHKSKKSRFAWLTKRRARRIVFWFGAGLIVLMGLFPPWVQTAHDNYYELQRHRTRYAFLLTGPSDAPDTRLTIGSPIDVSRLLVQCGLVVFVAGVAIYSIGKAGRLVLVDYLRMMKQEQQPQGSMAEPKPRPPDAVGERRPPV